MKNILLSFLIVATLNAKFTQKIKLPSISFPIAIDENFPVMQRNCQWCHSYGYILNQGPQSRHFWNKVVVKMRDVYKAPISPQDEKLITNYLFKKYGKKDDLDIK